MYPTKETLSAFIDGELDATERAHVAAIVENDPKLRAFVDEQEQLRATLQAAFAGVIAEPVPEQLRAAVANAPASFRVRLRRWLGERPATARDGSAGRFVAPALTLALGLIVGVGVERSSTSTNNFALSPSSGEIVASAELAATLDKKLASEQQTGAARVGVTFRDKAGALCRSFEVSDDSNTTDGLACHHDGDWRVGALVSRPASRANPNYSLAGSSMPDAIRDAITARMQGAPFDAPAERQARDRGWN